MSNFYGATSLIGGGVGALDAIDGADLTEGDGVIVINDGTTYTYRLDATSGASEDSPNVISPDDNPGDKRWVLQSMAGIDGVTGAHYATREYVDIALGAFKPLFLSDTSSGVGALNLAYPQETGEGESTIITSAMVADDPDPQLVKGFITEVGEPGTTTLHEGILEIHIHAKKGDTNQRTTQLSATISKVDANGTSNKVEIATSELTPELTDTETLYNIHAAFNGDIEVDITSRLICDIYATVGAGAQDAVVTLYMEGIQDSYFSIKIDPWMGAADVETFGRPIVLLPQASCGPAADFATRDTIAGSSTPAEVVSVLDFDAGAIEYADFKVPLPAGYDGGGLTITVIFSATSDHDEGTPHKVRWEVAIRRINDDAEDINTSHSYQFNGVSAIVPSEIGEVSYDDITFTDGADMDNWAAGEMAILRIRRKYDHADDNATGDAELHIITIKET